MTDAKQTPTVEGVEIVLGGRTLTLPAIPLVAMPRAQPFFSGSADPMTDAGYQQALVDIVYLSLKRNYPDIEPQFVADNVDLANFTTLITAIMIANKLKAPAVEEAGNDPALAAPKTGAKSGSKPSSTPPSAADGQ